MWHRCHQIIPERFGITCFEDVHVITPIKWIPKSHHKMYKQFERTSINHYSSVDVISCPDLISRKIFETFCVRQWKVLWLLWGLKRHQVHVFWDRSASTTHGFFVNISLGFFYVFEISIIIKTLCSLCKHTKEKCFKVNQYEFSCSNCNVQISVNCCLKLTMVLNLLFV